MWTSASDEITWELHVTCAVAQVEGNCHHVLSLERENSEFAPENPVEYGGNLIRALGHFQKARYKIHVEKGNPIRKAGRGSGFRLGQCLPVILLKGL